MLLLLSLLVQGGHQGERLQEVTVQVQGGNGEVSGKGRVLPKGVDSVAQLLPVPASQEAEGEAGEGAYRVGCLGERLKGPNINGGEFGEGVPAVQTLGANFGSRENFTNSRFYMPQSFG